MGKARASGSYRAHAELLQDYVFTRQPPLAADLAGRFAAVQVDAAGNDNRLLSVAADNRQLVLYEPDRDSASAWAQCTEAVPSAPAADIQRLVAFWHADALHVIVHYPNKNDPHGSRAHIVQRGNDRVWRAATLDSGALNLLECTRQMGLYQDRDGRLLVYGVSTNYEEPRFFIARRDGRGWQRLHQEQVGQVEQGYGIVAGRGRGELIVVESGAGGVRLRGASLDTDHFAWTGTDVSLKLAFDVAEVQSFSAPSLAESFLARARDGGLYLVAGYAGSRPDVLALSGLDEGPSKVRSVCTGVDARGRTIVFAIDGGGRLWILRQSEGARGVTRRVRQRAQGAFEPWVQLGDACAAIACPPVMGDAGEVFLASIRREVQRLGQDSLTGLWSENLIEVPRDSQDPPVAASTYSVNLGTLDANGLPQAHRVVEVRSDRATTLYGNGIAYSVDRDHAAQFATDATGNLSIVLPAGDLVAPTLMLHIPDQMKSGQFATLHPDRAMHRRLAGLDPAFPVDAKSMKTAEVLPATLPDADARDTVRAVKAVATYLVEKGQADDGLRFNPRALPCKRFAFTVGPNGRVRFRALTRTQHQTELRRLHQSDASILAAPAAASGTAWGDFVNWLKHAGATISKFLYEVVNGVVHFAVTVAGKVSRFVLSSVAAAGRILDVVFASVEAAVAKAIEWLRWVFDWKAILQTADRLAGHINTALHDMSAFAATAGEQVGRVIDEAISGVDGYFEALQRKIGKASLDQLFSGRKAGLRGSPLLDRSVLDARDRHAVQCNFLSNRMPRQPDSLAALTGGLTALDTASASFFDALKEAWPRDRLARSMRKLTKMFGQLGDGGHFLQCGLMILLELIKDVIVIVLEVLKAVLTSLLGLLSDGLSGLSQWLNTEINVPVVSAIFKLISGGKSLTVMRLFTMLLAVPLTILSKVLTGRGPFQRAPKRGPRRHDAGPQTTVVLPILYSIRAVEWAQQYAYTYAAAPDSPAPPHLKIASGIGTLCTMACFAIEKYPYGLGTRAMRRAEADANRYLAMFFNGLAGLVGAGYFVYGKLHATTVAGDVAVQCNRGFLELLGAIAMKNSDEGESVKVAKAFLTAFPDIAMAGSLNKEPGEAVASGVLGGVAYVGAAVCSGFIEVG